MINRKMIFTLPVVTMAIAIFVMSSIHQVPFIDDTIIGQDKLLHMTAYFVFGILLQFAVVAQKPNLTIKKTYFVVALIAILFALGDEIHQHFVPGRMCDFWDFAADSIGILLSLLLLPKIKKFVLSKLK
jgi:VanZ family protein